MSGGISVIETKKKKSKRKRSSGKGLERSLKWFLDKGPQRKGGYPVKRSHFQKKKFNNISAPPGAPGGLEEEVDPDSFTPHDVLEPNIWLNDDELKPEVRERLLNIAFDFIDAMDTSVTPQDVRLTGSLANYNWSDYSDVDLHIVVDFSKLDSDPTLVKKFFDAYRLRWNDKHNITIYGYEVEIYVENVGESHHSSGIYSIAREEWIVEPDPDNARLGWSVVARKKSDDILTQINLIQLIVKRKPKAALRSIERLKKKISKMRQQGLKSSDRETSVGNIIFKILRRENALELLSKLKDEAYDSAFTLR